MEWTISNGLVVIMLTVLGLLMLLEVFRFIKDQLRTYFTKDMPRLVAEDSEPRPPKQGGGKPRRPRLDYE